MTLESNLVVRIHCLASGIHISVGSFTCFLADTATFPNLKKQMHRNLLDFGENNIYSAFIQYFDPRYRKGKILAGGV